MTVTTQPTRTDSLLRVAMRADAILTGVSGVVGLPLVGWLAKTSGTTVAFEKEMALFYMAYGIVVFGLSLLPSVKGPGLAVIIANVVYTVGAVALVLAGPFALTTFGVVATLGSGVSTLAFAELQYQGWRRIKA